MLHESLACVWSVITTKECHGRPVDTNASVNSLASFHAVMGPQSVYLASLYNYTAFIPFGLLNLKLCELIIACSTLSHNTLSACTNRLLVLTNVVLHTEFSQIRHRIGRVAS